MDFPIQPEEQTAAPREPRPQRELQRNSGAPLHPLLIPVVLTLITSLACTVARLTLVVKLNVYWSRGVPTLCYGAIAALPYGTLDTATAFMFEAISNAIAVQTYGNYPVALCHTANYSFGLSTSVMHSIYASLSAISAFDLFGTTIIQGVCWWRLYARYCKVSIFRWSLCWSLIVLGLDAVAVYEGSRIERSTISALSAVILTCTLIIFVLTLCVLQSRINRGKSGEDNLEIPYAIFTRHAATPSRGQIPNRVMMFNPNNA